MVPRFTKQKMCANSTSKIQAQITNSSLMFSVMDRAMKDTVVVGDKVGKIKMRVMHLAKKLRGDSEYIITAG